jgi:hypothetical protein
VIASLARGPAHGPIAPASASLATLAYRYAPHRSGAASDRPLPGVPVRHSATHPPARRISA